MMMMMMMTYVLQASATAFDVHQLTDSMSSITIDPSTLSSGEFIATHSQKKPSVAVLMPAEDHPRRPLPEPCVQHDMGGLDAATHVVFRHDDAVMSQTSVTRASTPGANFSQPISFQPATSHLQSTMQSALNADHSVDQFGCLDLQDLQDMLIGDDFQ